MPSIQPTLTDVPSLISTLKENPIFSDDALFIYPESPGYAAETKVWGAQRNLSPKLVLKPKNVYQLQAITKSLVQSNLDFVVRNGSVGSASARDVLVSMGAFKYIYFNEATESLNVGAGCIWAEVDAYMEKNAPGWLVVGSRTPFVGVAGQVMIGGLSWLSHEYGLVSDPQNLCDVQMVLGNGRLLWASSEPDLLWAVRGGRCAFGVVTELKFTARRIKSDGIYAAQIQYPMTRLQEVSRGVSRHIAANQDPKCAFHAFVMNPDGPFFKAEPGVAVMPMDMHGAEHAKSADGFKWAFEIEDAKVEGGEMTFYDVNKLTDFAKTLMGTVSSFDATGLIDEVDEELVVRVKDWFYKVLESDKAFAAGSYCLLEACQPKAFGSTTPEETAWPHGKPKHVLQLGVGYMPEHAHLKPRALELLAEAFQTIPKKPLGKGDFTPTFIEPSVMDVREMYGDNYAKLEQIADKYDPQRRFRTLLNPDPNFAQDPTEQMQKLSVR